MRRALFPALVIPMLMMTGGGFPAWAQEEGDAPDHGVARVSLVNGEVSVTHGDSGEMVAASPNAPMVTGDRILTGDNARAEVQFDGVNLMRVAPGTEVRMGDLQYHRYLVQVAQGMVMFRVLQDVPQESAADVEISTPSVSLRPRRQGIYRVVVRPDGTSELTVRAGDAEIFAPTGSEPLGAGQTIISRGSADDPEFQNVTPPPYDEWDRWSADRDRVFERATQSSQYVNPDVYGTEDLGNYGQWTTDPEYGNVWVPNVDADWAPYRLGRWSWVDYYGWSWVSYDPWGWAPYHYGRWYRGDRGWAWYPGAFGARQYWRPALVGFFGWGSPGFGASLSFSFGNVGWVPLAPREIYRPWYGRGYGGRGVTVVNNTNIFNTYRNGRFAGSITSVRTGDFGRGSIRNNSGFVRARGDDLARTGVIQGGMPFGPSREGRQFVSRQVNTRGMPRTNDNMRFYSAQRGQGGGRQAFAGGDSSQGSQRNFSQPGSGQQPAQQDRGGFRRFGAAAPDNSNANRQDRSAAPDIGAGSRRDSGFRRFDAASPRTDNPGGFDSPRTGGFRGAGAQQRNNGPGNTGPVNGGPSNVSVPPAARNGDSGQSGFRRFGGNRSSGTDSGSPAPLPQRGPQGFSGGARPNIEQAGPPAQTQRPDRVQQDRAPQDRIQQDRSFGGFGSQRQQPVRIAPPIVTDRNEYRSQPQQRSAPRENPGFGAARPNYGGEIRTQRPQENGGGGRFRGNSGGSAPQRGNDNGGGGGGNRGDGGRRGGGRSR